MKFIVLDRKRIGGLNVTSHCYLGLKAVAVFEPKRASWSGGLVLVFNDGYQTNTESERFCMRLFGAFHFLKRAPNESGDAGAVSFLLISMRGC